MQIRTCRYPRFVVPTWVGLTLSQNRACSKGSPGDGGGSGDVIFVHSSISQVKPFLRTCCLRHFADFSKTRPDMGQLCAELGQIWPLGVGINDYLTTWAIACLTLTDRHVERSSDRGVCPETSPHSPPFPRVFPRVFVQQFLSKSRSKRTSSIARRGVAGSPQIRSEPMHQPLHVETRKPPRAMRLQVHKRIPQHDVGLHS